MTAPTPHVLAAELRLCADLLDRSGPAAVRMAEVLAARGWPSHSDSGGGTPDPDGDVTLTSVESAASHPTMWDDIDTRLAKLMENSWRGAVALSLMVGNVTAHADPESTDRAIRQPGSGACLACGDHASGSNNDRLKSGFDPKCYTAWNRAGCPDRAWWIRRRREELAAKAPVHIDPTAPIPAPL